MKKYNFVTLLALAIAPTLIYAESSTSNVVGYTTLNVRGKTGSANALSFIGLNLHRPSVFTGTINSKSVNGSGQSTLSFSSPNFIASQFIGAGNRHYIRITSANANTGLISEIVANDTASITVADNLNAVIDANVSAVEIRPYWTLATAFPSGAGLKSGTSASTADTLSIVDPTSGTVYSYFYSSSNNQWKRGNTDSSSIVIPPGSGILVTRRDVNPVSIVITGEVIGTTIQADVAGGTATSPKSTYVANPFPLASKTLAQSGLYTGNPLTGVVGGTSAATADVVTIYDVSTGTGYAYYYNTSQSIWKRGNTDSSGIVIPDGAAVVITRQKTRGAFDWYIPSPVNL